MIDKLPAELVHIICNYLSYLCVPELLNSKHHPHHQCRFIFLAFTNKRCKDVVYDTESYEIIRYYYELRLICYNGASFIYNHLLCLCNTSDPWLLSRSKNVLRRVKYYYRSNIFNLTDFFYACQHGYIDVVKWMHTTYNLTQKDGRIYDNNPLRRACQYGKLELVEWICTTYNLTSKDARSYRNDSLGIACKYGNLELVKWLHKTFELTIDDVRECWAFSISCKKGHLEQAKWLHATFGLTTEDARKNSNTILWKLCRKGNLEGAMWLQSTFNLTTEDAKSNNNRALRAALRNDHLDVVQWLNNTFKLL